MKIAFLNIYQGVVSRGAENFVKEISTRLAQEHKVDIYSWSGKISEEKARRQTGFNFWGKVRYKFYFDSHSLRVLLFTLSITPKLLRTKYDWIIPVDGGWQLAILKLFQLLGIGRYQLLVSGQAGIGRDDLRHLKMQPQVFVALTARAAGWASGVSRKVKVVFIPNGVDLNHFQAKGLSANVGLEQPMIICVAGMNPYKRINLSIQAVAGLEKGSLLVLGDGPIKNEIEELGKKVLGKNRFARMSVDYKKMPEYYRAVRAFTLVSASSEAFGSAYVEAMACGLPVVATDDENRREIVGEAGIFVNPENQDEYTQALAKALKTDWGDKPRRQAEKFSWDKIAKEYEQTMASLC